MNEENRIKRLRYRSWHRGCKETDLVLGRFADEKLAGLSPAMVETYERLLDENDADIWQWLTGKTAPPEYGILIEIMKKTNNEPSLRGGSANEAIQ